MKEDGLFPFFMIETTFDKSWYGLILIQLEIGKDGHLLRCVKLFKNPNLRNVCECAIDFILRMFSSNLEVDLA